MLIIYFPKVSINTEFRYYYYEFIYLVIIFVMFVIYLYTNSTFFSCVRNITAMVPKYMPQPCCSKYCSCESFSIFWYIICKYCYI